MENDDSCSDSEWREAELKKRKNKKLSRLDIKRASTLSENDTKPRVLPRRAVTLNKKSIIESAEVDSEVDSDDNE